jgi:uncharacterized ubiquitin-like protein YukD
MNEQLNANRLRLTTLDKKLLAEDNKPLSEYGVKDGEVLELKDLGAQVGAYSLFSL